MTEEQLGVARALLGRRGLTELLAVLEGAKPVMRVLLHQGCVADLMDLVQALGLTGGVSEYRVIPQAPVAGTVHGHRLARDDETTAASSVHAYIGAEPVAVHLARLFDGADPVRFGRLLGYPDCCVSFFLDCTERRHLPDGADLVAAVGWPPSGRYDPLINYACRHFGYALISHFPCRWDCEGSLAVATGTLSALEKHAPELARETLTCLETDVAHALPYVVAWRERRTGDCLRVSEAAYHTGELMVSDLLRLRDGRLEVFRDGAMVAQAGGAVWLPFRSQSPVPEKQADSA
ncbi:MAG: hypothetical protein HPY44_11215 [Armatimonadetes bacterium]|nr:hypothetical protein [Armatimonadota bacterium]